MPLGGPDALLSLACSSGTAVLGVAMEWIQTGLVERVVAGGFEALSEYCYAGLSSLRAMSRNMREVLKLRQFWYLALWNICAVGTLFSFGTMWAGPYLMDAYGLNKIEAGRILLFQGLGVLILVPVFGSLADRLNSRRGMIIACSALGFIGSCGLAFFAGSLPPALLAGTIMIMAASAAGGNTCTMSLVKRNLPHNMIGTGVGCVNMFWPITTAVLNLLLGLMLRLFLTPDATTAQAYGHTLLVYVGLWAVALGLGIFCLREHFAVSRSA